MVWEKPFCLKEEKKKRSFSGPASVKKQHAGITSMVMIMIMVNLKVKGWDGSAGKVGHWSCRCEALHVLTQGANFAVIHKSSSLWGCNIYTLIKKS